MAFRLVVARGNHAGQQFIAVQAEVYAGRESGNDVILSDPGVSGRHARFAERAGRITVEDLGTPNGTFVNGERIAGARELSRGDTVALGTAVLQLQELEGRKKLVPDGVGTSPEAPTGGRDAIIARAREADTEPTAPLGKPLFAREEKTEQVGKPLNAAEIAEAMATGGGERQAVLSQTAVRSPPGPADTAADDAGDHDDDHVHVHVHDHVHVHARARAHAPVSEPASDPSPAATARELPPVPEGQRITKDGPTDEHDAVETAIAPNLPAAAHALTTPEPVLVPAGVALKRAPDVAPLPPTAVQVPRAVQDDLTAPSGHAIILPAGSAADRARRRREAQATLGGQLAYLWSGVSLRARLVIAGALGVVATVVSAGLWQIFHPSPERELPPEPQLLSGAPIPFSFGLGDVDYERADFKELRFEVKAPTAAAALLHYQAQDIGPDEVSISVNGTEVGFVPADIGIPDRELEALLSQFLLKRNAENAVVFDNVKNPPGHERWRISHLWLELIPVPETSRDGALTSARASLERGATLEKQHANGDDMLFRAWRAYRDGWLSLLALHEEDRGTLFSELKRRADALRLELDTQCGTLMLDAKKQMELKNPDAAREILEGVPRFFPTRDHPCHALAEEKLTEYDL
jgi:hypothetical protein